MGFRSRSATPPVGGSSKRLLYEVHALLGRRHGIRERVNLAGEGLEAERPLVAGREKRANLGQVSQTIRLVDQNAMRIEHVRHGDPQVADAGNVNQPRPFGKELRLARKVMVKRVVED